MSVLPLSLAAFGTPPHTNPVQDPPTTSTIAEPDYIDRTLFSTPQLWSQLQSLAACRDYREISMLAGARIVQSLKLAGGSDVVRAAIGCFEPAPILLGSVQSNIIKSNLSIIPQYSADYGHSRDSSEISWDELKRKISRLPDYSTAAPTQLMADNVLPVLRPKLAEMQSERSRRALSTVERTPERPSIRSSASLAPPPKRTRL